MSKVVSLSGEAIDAEALAENNLPDNLRMLADRIEAGEIEANTALMVTATMDEETCGGFRVFNYDIPIMYIPFMLRIAEDSVMGFCEKQVS